MLFSFFILITVIHEKRPLRKSFLVLKYSAFDTFSIVLVMDRELPVWVLVMLEGENGCFLWAVWLYILCKCLSVRIDLRL
jgi:hypothetical protein